MLLLAVLAQRFAMIAEDDDERAIEPSGGCQMTDQPAHLDVRLRDLSIVGADHRRRKP